MGGYSYGALTYGPDRSMQLNTSTPGVSDFPVTNAGAYSALFGSALADKRRLAMAEEARRQQAFELEMQGKELALSRASRVPPEDQRANAEAVKAGMQTNTPWYSAQGAAMRPVGLGPAMTPGMGIDPRLLPPEMRPESAGMSNVGMQAQAISKGLDAADWAAFQGDTGARKAIQYPEPAVPPTGTAPMLTPSNAAVIAPNHRAAGATPEAVPEYPGSNYTPGGYTRGGRRAGPPSPGIPRARPRSRS